MDITSKEIHFYIRQLYNSKKICKFAKKKRLFICICIRKLEGMTHAHVVVERNIRTVVCTIMNCKGALRELNLHLCL